MNKGYDLEDVSGRKMCKPGKNWQALKLINQYIVCPGIKKGYNELSNQHTLGAQPLSNINIMQS